MPDRNPPKFYATRAARARALAEAARDPAVAAKHKQLADSYAELARYQARVETPVSNNSTE